MTNTFNFNKDGYGQITVTLNPDDMTKSIVHFNGQDYIGTVNCYYPNIKIVDMDKDLVINGHRFKTMTFTNVDNIDEFSKMNLNAWGKYNHILSRTLSDDEVALIGKPIKYEADPFEMTNKYADKKQIKALAKKYIIDNNIDLDVDYDDLYLSVINDSNIYKYCMQNGKEVGYVVQTVLTEDIVYKAVADYINNLIANDIKEKTAEKEIEDKIAKLTVKAKETNMPQILDRYADGDYINDKIITIYVNPDGTLSRTTEEMD